MSQHTSPPAHDRWPHKFPHKPPADEAKTNRFIKYLFMAFVFFCSFSAMIALDNIDKTLRTINKQKHYSVLKTAPDMVIIDQDGHTYRCENKIYNPARDETVTDPVYPLPDKDFHYISCKKSGTLRIENH